MTNGNESQVGYYVGLLVRGAELWYRELANLE